MTIISVSTVNGSVSTVNGSYYKLPYPRHLSDGHKPWYQLLRDHNLALFAVRFLQITDEPKNVYYYINMVKHCRFTWCDINYFSRRVILWYFVGEEVKKLFLVLWVMKKILKIIATFLLIPLPLLLPCWLFKAGYSIFNCPNSFAIL